MNQYITELKKYYIEDSSHHSYRVPPTEQYKLAQEFKKKGLNDTQRAKYRLKWMLEHENIVVFPHEKISILRTIPIIPEIFTQKEWAYKKKSYRIHELGKVCNINPHYSSLIDVGFDRKREEIQEVIHKFSKQKENEKITYLQTLLEVLDMIEEFSERYRVEAIRVGNKIVSETFSHIPQQPPRNFLEALQFFRLLHFCLWESYNYHNTIGRFDQYMLPYYEADIEANILDKESALTLLEEFFISFNKDSDLYPGMQQGDNGQSMVLGGLDSEGRDTFNDLSILCMQASMELKLIDPKINLRVHDKTPLEVYILGTQMTKLGLGFPQYSNDMIVIPALEKWGYSHADASNYVVAACWEFIIPEVAMDIVNIDALSFLKSILDVLPEIMRCDTYEEFALVVKKKIFLQAAQICANTTGLYMEPAPLISLMTTSCIENGIDISKGALYNNYGIHGTGLSSAADSLAAIKKYIYEEKSLDKQTLLDALEADFNGYEDLFTLLRYRAPKMGNDDDYVDSIATELLDWFADSLEGHQNGRKGIFRPGTGSAMYYLWHGNQLGASPDGRKKGEEFACNFSPSLFTRSKGPVSLIKSFSKAHLNRVANGGPLTIELHDTMFRNEESIEKVAKLVKTYMEIGGMQLQLNGVNRDTMLEAQKHPEKYRDLIVRVWGWSGYFVELDKEYQDHIIKRMEFEL
ncbi:MAG: pyruvate formate-lyase [Spirochaetia bacterium]|nr:pyruvate formate-lyase [Spirochaetia bacterium]